MECLRERFTLFAILHVKFATVYRLYSSSIIYFFNKNKKTALLTDGHISHQGP